MNHGKSLTDIGGIKTDKYARLIVSKLASPDDFDAYMEFYESAK